MLDCGSCNGFHDYARRHFAQFLAAHNFTPVQCAAEHGGRECLILYESPRCRLLFSLQDGSSDCSLGALDAPFPDWTVQFLIGDGGWYNTHFLLEFILKKRMPGRRLWKAILDGRADYFEWLSNLVLEHADLLMDLFAPQKQRMWQADFARYAQSRR